jgi:hypothetical protein
LLLQINKYAFSGGGATLDEHRAKGANLDVDVPWKYLNFFMEDDAKLGHIGREYGAGRMLTGEGVPVTETGVGQQWVSMQATAARSKLGCTASACVGVPFSKGDCGVTFAGQYWWWNW